MNFIQNQTGLRVFYLGITPSPVRTVLCSKNGGPFGAPANPLLSLGLGWYSLALTMADTDTIGPLAWSFGGNVFLSQPQDLVIALPHGVIDQTALEGAFRDLSVGFAAGMPLGELLRRPLFQFLLSLK